MNIADLPIPQIVKDKLAEEGILSLYPPQIEAINKKLLEGNNLVVAIPTASGKTLLAILASLKNITDSGLKTLYLSPLRALAHEKFVEFKNYLDLLGKKTVLLTGDYDGEESNAKYADVIIATNEKIDSAIRHQAKWITKIGLVVADEVHLINDSSRGPTLEVVIAQLRKLTKAQIIALSATIRNADEIARWLEAELVSSDWRPVKLNEGVLNGNQIIYKDHTDSIPLIYKNSFNNLITHILKKKKQALVFVSTRNTAESTARNLINHVKKTLTKEEQEQLLLAARKITSSGEQTKQSKNLAQLVQNGVSFHHAGLNPTQRRIVEDNFKKGCIKILSATPTLCLSKDTKVWSEMNEIDIAKYPIEKPVYALEKNNIIQIRPLEINEIDNDKTLIQIDSTCGYSIKLTPKHRVLIKRKNVKIAIPAEDVDISDKIATLGKFNFDSQNILHVNQFVKDNQVECLNVKIDETFASFIGLMLGDGYSGAEINNNKIVYKGPASIVNNDKEVLATVEKICKLLSLNCNRHKNTYGTPEIIISKTKWFREMLARMGVVKGTDKHIAQELLYMNKRNITYLLRGLFDSDGYVSLTRNIGFANTSIKLIMQVQKLLLRFGIVSRIREKKPGIINLGKKSYRTRKSYELIIGNKTCILNFEKFIGFGIKRKSRSLGKLKTKIEHNFLYTECKTCNYKIYRDLFTGKTHHSRIWGKQKSEIIKLLGTKGELGSRAIAKILDFEPKKNVSRLNHHYQLIQKRKIGKKSQTEWFWSLNTIGRWIFQKLLKEDNLFMSFFEYKMCPICNNELEKILYKGWKSADFDGDVYWDIIRNIKKIPAEEKVYDLVLPSYPKNNHLFIANGFFVHNSAGINLPARYVIIKSIYRYDVTLGSYPIPVLEFKQQSGRAGRPQFDKEGDAIVIAKNEYDAQNLLEMYITADTEDIDSKIAAEPALRRIVLGQIATDNTQSLDELHEFFGQTFYGYQQDPTSLSTILRKVIKFLREEGLITKDPDYLIATSFGKRVSQLYIDPLSGITIREGLMKAKTMAKGLLTDISFLHLVCSTPDVRFTTVKKADQFKLINYVSDHEDEFLVD
ncbi:MAG: DEAD/DEAH box helicase, partial [Candidatus Heimdallarchaeaceae archaeon]